MPAGAHEISLLNLEEPEDWRYSIKVFIEEDLIADDDLATERLAQIAKNYIIIDGVLYKNGRNGMLMRCISTDEGIRLLNDINEGVCGSHNFVRTLIGKAFHHGFYWPTAN